MTTVSRDMVRAILEARDHRHNETHAILLAMFQGLVAELVEQGVLAPEPLAERLALASSRIDEDPLWDGRQGHADPCGGLAARHSARAAAGASGAVARAAAGRRLTENQAGFVSSPLEGGEHLRRAERLAQQRLGAGQVADARQHIRAARSCRRRANSDDAGGSHARRRRHRRCRASGYRSAAGRTRPPGPAARRLRRR